MAGRFWPVASPCRKSARFRVAAAGFVRCVGHVPSVRAVVAESLDGVVCISGLCCGCRALRWDGHVPSVCAAAVGPLAGTAMCLRFELWLPSRLMGRSVFTVCAAAVGPLAGTAMCLRFELWLPSRSLDRWSVSASWCRCRAAAARIRLCRRSRSLWFGAAVLRLRRERMKKGGPSRGAALIHNTSSGGYSAAAGRMITCTRLPSARIFCAIRCTSSFVRSRSACS